MAGIAYYQCFVGGMLPGLILRLRTNTDLKRTQTISALGESISNTIVTYTFWGCGVGPSLPTTCAGIDAVEGSQTDISILERISKHDIAPIFVVLIFVGQGDGISTVFAVSAYPGNNRAVNRRT